MRKSGHRAGTRGEELGSADAGRSRKRRPKRWSHSGPDRYVMVAISIDKSLGIRRFHMIGPTSCKFHSSMRR